MRLGRLSLRYLRLGRWVETLAGLAAGATIGLLLAIIAQALPFMVQP